MFRSKLYGPSLLNRAHPSAQGLVSMWIGTPNLSAGRIWYDSCGQNNWTFQSVGQTWASGRLGTPSSVSFDGTNRATMTNPANLKNISPFSMGGWIYQTSQAASYQALYADGSVIGFYMHGGKIDWVTPSDHNGATVIALNTWYHVFFTYDGSVLTGYINGIADYGPTSVASLKTCTGATIGLGGDGASNTEKFTGFMQEWRVYNLSLSSAQVQYVYLESLTGYKSLFRRLYPKGLYGTSSSVYGPFVYGDYGYAY